MMFYIVVVMLIGAGVLFVGKRPLQIAAVRATRGQPIMCPACNSFFSAGGAPGAIVHCTDCGAYSQLGADGAPTAVPPDFVASTYAFQTYLPEAPRWPPRRTA